MSRRVPVTSNRQSAPEMGNETSTAVAGSPDKAHSDRLFKVRLADCFKGTACHLSLQIMSCVSVSIRPSKIQQLCASWTRHNSPGSDCCKIVRVG